MGHDPKLNIWLNSEFKELQTINFKQIITWNPIWTNVKTADKSKFEKQVQIKDDKAYQLTPIICC